MKTIINKIDHDWIDIKNKCRTTVNKEHTLIEPTQKFKMDLLISEHSPIRLLNVNWMWEKIKSFVATHFSRHKWECFISTQRSDRTGVDRSELSQEESVTFEGYANAQNLIDTMRKRLCFQSSEETRLLAEDLKKTLRQYEPELSDVLVPNCIYRCGCPEFESCGYWEAFKKQNPDVDLSDIRSRYKDYNFWM